MRATQWVSTLTNVVLVLCAVVVTGLVVRRELFRSSPAVASAAPEPVTVVDDWRGYAAEGHRWGPDPAPVSLVVFSDYQCPACRRLAEDLKVIRAEFPEQVAVVIRHIPIPSHPFALPAARASECAARQERFVAFHHALFAGQALIGVEPWARFARDARLPDLPAFDACMAETGPVAAVDRDRAAAQRLEVDRTPTLLINGHRYAGAPSLPTLRQRVRRAVEQAPRTASAAAATGP